MGLKLKTKQNKTRMGLSLRHNKGKTQNIKQKWATRMSQPFEKILLLKKNSEDFFFWNFLFWKKLFLENSIFFFLRKKNYLQSTHLKKKIEWNSFLKILFTKKLTFS